MAKKGYTERSKTSHNRRVLSASQKMQGSEVKDGSRNETTVTITDEEEMRGTTREELTEVYKELSKELEVLKDTQKKRNSSRVVLAIEEGANLRMRGDL